MKKLFIAILLFLIISTFAFADHTLAIKPTIVAGTLSHAYENTVSKEGKIDFGLSTEYIYIFDNGISIGANMGVYDISHIIQPNVTVNLTSELNGSDLQFSPVIGITQNGDIFFMQILFYPVIFELADYNSHTLTVNNVTYKSDETKSLNTIKTGIMASISLGWERFKIGLGIGGNLILSDDFAENSSVKGGLELVLSNCLTFFF